MSNKERAGFLAQVIKVGERILLSPPRTALEALWRGFALWFLSSVIGVGLVVGYRPDFVFMLLDINQSSLSLQYNSRRVEVVKVIRTFIDRHRPSRFALVGQVSTVGIELVWSNEDMPQWPTAVDGVMSEHMKEVVGPLAFGECWTGELEADPEGTWVFCGISDDGDQKGYIVASYPKDLPVEVPGSMRNLAMRIREILF